MKFVIALVMILVIPVGAGAQTTFQAKPVVHSPVPTEPSFYPAFWSITNIREDATDNTNIMLGLGRKLDKGWLEVMAMHQRSFASYQWFVDVRYQRPLPKRFAAQLEVAPFIGRKALYTFARLERPVLGRVNALVETENVFQSGADLISVGGGISLRPMKLTNHIRFSPVAVWYTKPNEGTDFIRFYLAFPL